ncbi:PAS domain-containing protein [Cellulosimicrobium cellulans]|uniref:PAS and ANTAR domain-containing protein n=1 Tax=Cellulosimicrobium cellulans TaxID=1710 RepID=UPI001EDACD2A|nr:PAS and ANTAR domain-containing protein [Cellulosimicrobium cellulans]UKJ62671.1 PAS domain-containing protein [Cellulosimicrobium cellulans]
MASISVTTNHSPERTTPVRPAALAEVLAVGTHLLVGQYRVELGSGSWWWSDEVYTMHGWTPGDVEPSLDALRSRKHPDDRARVVRAATEAIRSGRPFSCAHRIVDGHGKARSVVVTGQGRRDARGRVVEIAGYVVDVSPTHKEALERESQRAVTRAFVSQAAVEQAKGVLMAVHGVDDVAASQLLAEAAGEAGVPVQETAAQVMRALSKAGGVGPTAEATLAGAFAAVRPVARPRAHDAQLARRREPARS